MVTHRLGIAVAAVALPLLASGEPCLAGQAPVDSRFGTVAEGLTANQVGGTLRAGYRLFTVPDFSDVCRAAHAESVTRLRSGSASVTWRLGGRYDFQTLKIEAVDANGSLLPRVPVSIEVEQGSDVLNSKTADSIVVAGEAGATRLRIRTICEGPSANIEVRIAVTRQRDARR